MLGLAVAACTGSHASPTSPSALATASSGVGIVTTMANCPGNNQCNFGASATVLSGSYTGTTTATSAPGNGHHGQLTLTFGSPVSGPVTFTWSNFHTGSQATCFITGPGGFNEQVSCNDGSKTFANVQSGLYTFTDKENPQQSNDKWQTATYNVTTGTGSVSVTATWKSTGGYAGSDDDPSVTYSGSLAGSLSTTLDGTLYANAGTPTKCGLGGGLPAASHFHVSVTGSTANGFSGSYAAQDCTIDQGTYSVSK